MEAWSRFRVQDSWRSPFTTRLPHPEIPIPLPTDDTRLVPFAVAALCALIQFLHLVVHLWKSHKSRHVELESEDGVVVATGSLTRWQRIKNHVKWYGSGTIYAFLVIRLIGSTTLLVLSMIALSKCRAASMWPPVRYISGCPEVLLVMTFVYTTFLSILALVSKSWSTSSARYTNAILLSVFGLYIYRDIWPLATTYMDPQDGIEGWRMWAKIGTVVFTAVFIPLFIPRRYTPVDPKNPLAEPNPEQTASIISRATYSFLDPLIALGYSVPHLSPEQIPPLADYDYSEYQSKTGFPHMDVFYGAKRRHLFWGLLIHFRWDYIVLAVTVVIYALTTFSAPIGINQLLQYIETQGHNARIRPWFWIAWLFFGPLAQSFSFQYYLFVATRTLVRIEILVTQLVFEHSLRIRLKAEAGGDDESSGSGSGSGKNKAFASATTSGASTAATTPDNRSVVGSDDDVDAEGSVGSTVVSRQATDATDTTAVPVAQGAKGKGKAKKAKQEEEEKKKEEKDTENVIGKINNLVSTDVGNITDGRDFLLLTLYVPLQITLCMTFLYRLLGWSAFIGLGVMIALFPLPGYTAKLLQDVQSEKMKKTDARIQSVTEAVNVLRMVKLFGWEIKMSQRLRRKRDDELKLLWRYKLLDLANGLLSYLIPTLTMLVTFSAYTMLFKQELRASVIFPSMSVFSLLREQMQRIFWEASMIIQAKVSIDRVNEFLIKSELLDSYLKMISPTPALEIDSSTTHEDKIGFNNATFTWSLEDEEEDGTLTPSRRSFKLRVEGELLFMKNKINLIIGPTGAGKTSILMALLGEMHFVKNYPDSWFSLPRKGGVAYASQESWVQNETIKNNILFGAEYDEERYNKVIKQCALERDLELFEAGDKTEVGERGLTLSGGQKARVTLARAIYSSAEVILLDDVLAALDVHTAAWIVDHCFRCDLVKGRTVLLVTHNVALASPVAEHIVTIGIDGSITAKGNDLKAALASDKKLASEVQKDSEILANAESAMSSTAASAESQTAAAGGQGPDTTAAATKAPDGKLMVAEEIVEGHVTWKSLKLLFNGLGGNHPILFFFTVAAGLAITDWCSTFQTWFLGYWASQYETRPGSEVDSAYYLTIYSSLLAGAFTIYSATCFFFTLGALRASKTINNRLVDSVFGSTLRWLDETPTGRIIARCTQDMRAIDGPVPQMFVWCLDTSLAMVTKLAVIVMFSPIFLFPGLGVAGIGFYLGNMYLKAQLSVKREMSNAKSPMLAHFSAAIHGLVSIRAYGAEAAFKAESLKRINHYARIARTSYNLNRWIGVRIDGLGAIFTASLASYLIYWRSISASNTGFSLAMAVEFSLFILWVVRLYNEFEVQANSLERIQGYIDIEHEPKPTESGKPPAAWPTSGDLRVEKLVARYSTTGPKVLHEISFHVKSGERVGVVGRTGSGKSSLTLALLRCILTEGNVYYDGIATNTINLDALRSSITIIPQIPELLSGTLRQNLDPFDQNDDATLNDALRSAGLFSLQEDAGEARLSLDSKIAGGGANLSVGQRQILALARAMVRGSKLLILDEATSAIDYKTDAIIQGTLRRELPKDVTIITIAHRLQTIMDADKVLVLDEGRIVEFDSPKNLLHKESGTLKDLVEGSGEKEALYALAEAHST